MKRLLTALALALLAVTPALPQREVRVYTRPELPSRDALHRLNLKLAWTAKLHTEGVRDGIESVQLLPADGQDQLLVQTLRGLIILMDADTGDILWRNHLGEPYDPAQPAAFNEQNVFATRRERFYVLNRANGNQRLYQVDKKGHTVFGIPLQSAPTAAAAADEDAVFVIRDINLTAYLLPKYSFTEKVAAREAARADAPPPLRLRSSEQPTFLWNAMTYGVSVLTPPLLFKDGLAVCGSGGTFISFNKYDGSERFRYKFQGRVSAPMGQHGRMAYVGSEDFTLYAMNFLNGRLLWRFEAGGPIRRQPYVTDQDVFVRAGRTGLFRVDRDSGEARWHAREAVQFLATNQKFVYATDREGKLLVLDYLRGTPLAAYDMSGFTVPFGNETTDRIYLGAHDGTLICLHHRDNALPLRVRSFTRAAPPKGEPPPPEMKKEEEKKEEMKKEDMKKEDLKKEEMKKEDMKKEEEKKEDMKKEEKNAGWLRQQVPGVAADAPAMLVESPGQGGEPSAPIPESLPGRQEGLVDRPSRIARASGPGGPESCRTAPSLALRAGARPGIGNPQARSPREGNSPPSLALRANRGIPDSSSSERPCRSLCTTGAGV